jgi:putative holliday junction resolvase
MCLKSNSIKWQKQGMRYLSKDEFWQFITSQKVTRVLGLDISPTKIGLGILNLGTQSVTPLKPIFRKKLKLDAMHLQKIFQDYGINLVIVGWPLNMDGSEGPRCQSVKDTLFELGKYLPNVSILVQDERLTTQVAQTEMRNLYDKSNGAIKGLSEDSLAACEILQRAMDAAGEQKP